MSNLLEEITQKAADLKTQITKESAENLTTLSSVQQPMRGSWARNASSGSSRASTRSNVMNVFKELIITTDKMIEKAKDNSGTTTTNTVAAPLVDEGN